MMNSEYFDLILHNKDIKKFKELFGGNFSYSVQLMYTYEYGNKMYTLMDNENFIDDIKKSIEINENILLTYPQVSW